MQEQLFWIDKTLDITLSFTLGQTNVYNYWNCIDLKINSYLSKQGLRRVMGKRDRPTASAGSFLVSQFKVPAVMAMLVKNMRSANQNPLVRNSHSACRDKLLQGLASAGPWLDLRGGAGWEEEGWFWGPGFALVGRSLVNGKQTNKKQQQKPCNWLRLCCLDTLKSGGFLWNVNLLYWKVSFYCFPPLAFFPSGI